jgi:hypothetical protein
VSDYRIIRHVPDSYAGRLVLFVLAVAITTEKQLCQAEQCKRIIAMSRTLAPWLSDAERMTLPVRALDMLAWTDAEIGVLAGVTEAQRERLAMPSLGVLSPDIAGMLVGLGGRLPRAMPDADLRKELAALAPFRRDGVKRQTPGGTMTLRADFDAPRRAGPGSLWDWSRPIWER